MITKRRISGDTSALWTLSGLVLAACGGGGGGGGGVSVVNRGERPDLGAPVELRGLPAPVMFTPAQRSAGVDIDTTAIGMADSMAYMDYQFSPVMATDEALITTFMIDGVPEERIRQSTVIKLIGDGGVYNIPSALPRTQKQAQELASAVQNNMQMMVDGLWIELHAWVSPEHEGEIVWTDIHRLYMEAEIVDTTDDSSMGRFSIDANITIGPGGNPNAVDLMYITLGLDENYDDRDTPGNQDLTQTAIVGFADPDDSGVRRGVYEVPSYGSHGGDVETENEWRSLTDANLALFNEIIGDVDADFVEAGPNIPYFFFGYDGNIVTPYVPGTPIQHREGLQINLSYIFEDGNDPAPTRAVYWYSSDTMPTEGLSSQAPAEGRGGGAQATLLNPSETPRAPDTAGTNNADIVDRYGYHRIDSTVFAPTEAGTYWAQVYLYDGETETHQWHVVDQSVEVV